jgi:hypothetical protein
VVLINTEGSALIGPGSEWFWTAVSGAVLAVTFLAIYRQLRLQRLQMQENTKVLRSQAHYNALTLGQKPFEFLVQDEGLARIVNIGYRTPEALAEVDWDRFCKYFFIHFNGWEYFYYQHHDGSIPKELWVGGDAYFRDLVASEPGLRRFWAEYGLAYDEPFRSYVDAEFARHSDADAGATAD